jgi:rod shape-determining protein MreC
MANKGANRSRLLLITLLVTSLLLITLDLRGVSVVSSIRSGTQSALAPFQKVGSSLLSPVGQFFSDIFNFASTRNRLEKLENENKALRNQVILNEDVAGELRQLRGVLDLAGKARYRIVSARVISKGSTGLINQAIIIDKGFNAGIRPDMTVIAAEGLVGVVRSTTANSSVVALMSDPSFRIGVRVSGSQYMGILSGQGDGNFSLQMLSASAKLQIGDSLLARGSSGDSPYVPGVPVGEVKFVSNAVGQLTKNARVSSFVDLNALRIVSVVLAATAGDPGEALVPSPPKPTPTVTIYVTPTPSPSASE